MYILLQKTIHQTFPPRLNIDAAFSTLHWGYEW